MIKKAPRGTKKWPNGMKSMVWKKKWTKRKELEKEVAPLKNVQQVKKWKHKKKDPVLLEEVDLEKWKEKVWKEEENLKEKINLIQWTKAEEAEAPRNLLWWSEKKDVQNKELSI